MTKNVQYDKTRSVKDTAPAGRARRNDAVVSELVRRAAEGDQRAWDDLIDEFAGLVWAIARAFRLGDADAADVSQTTWLRLVENIDRLQDPCRVGAWLATTARRQCTQRLQRASRVIPRGDDLPEPVSKSPDPGAGLLTSERDHALWTALERLPDRDRRLLRMLIADPAPSYAEISAALEMPIGSIGPTRVRALERLRHEARRSGLIPQWGEPRQGSHNAPTTTTRRRSLSSRRTAIPKY
jgi:RNA polymerase sigma factor (sigma-70 family)